MINRNAVVQNMPEYRARPHRFRVICGESRTVTEISAMDAATMQDWVYTIRMVCCALLELFFVWYTASLGL